MDKPPYEKKALIQAIENCKRNIGTMKECIDKEETTIREYQLLIMQHEAYERSCAVVK